MRQFIIREDQLQQLCNYLVSRPFKEVADGLRELNSLPEHIVKEIKKDQAMKKEKIGLKEVPNGK